MRFVIDEDMPRSLGPALVKAGHDVWDVRDHGLQGHADEEVFRFAQEHEACFITEDLGFANILRFPLNSHHGIVVGRFPSILPTRTVVAEVARSLETLAEEPLRGALIIVEIGQTRIRRP